MINPFSHIAEIRKQNLKLGPDPVTLTVHDQIVWNFKSREYREYFHKFWACSSCSSFTWGVSWMIYTETFRKDNWSEVHWDVPQGCMMILQPTKPQPLGIVYNNKLSVNTSDFIQSHWEFSNNSFDNYKYNNNRLNIYETSNQVLQPPHFLPFSFSTHFLLLTLHPIKPNWVQPHQYLSKFIS